MAPLLGADAVGLPRRARPNRLCASAARGEGLEFTGLNQGRNYDDALLLRRQGDREGWLLLKNRGYSKVYHYDPGGSSLRTGAERTCGIPQRGSLSTVQSARGAGRSGLHVNRTKDSCPSTGRTAPWRQAARLRWIVWVAPRRREGGRLFRRRTDLRRWDGLVLGSRAASLAAPATTIFIACRRASESVRLIACPLHFGEESADVCWSNDEQFVIYRRSEVIRPGDCRRHAGHGFHALTPWRPIDRPDRRSRGPVKFDRVGKIKAVQIDVEVAVESSRAPIRSA